MKHGKWLPSLHPRGTHGRFAPKGGGGAKADVRKARTAQKAALKDARSAANPEARKQRRKGYRKEGFSTAGGVIKGAALVGIGVHTGDHKYTAAGVGRIGLAAAEGHHNLSSVRRTTSKDFHRQSLAAQEAELNRRNIKSAKFALAGGVADFAGAYYGRQKIVNNLATHVASGVKDKRWGFEKESHAEHPGVGDTSPFTRYQGPAPHRSRTAGTSRLKRNKGVYNITSQSQGNSKYKIGKPGRGLFASHTKVGTGRTRSQNAANAFRSARNTAQARAYQARGGSAAVVLRNSGVKSSKAVVRRRGR